MNDIQQSVTKLLAEKGNHLAVRDDYLKEKEAAFVIALQKIYQSVVDSIRNSKSKTPESLSINKEKLQKDLFKLEIISGLAILDDATKQVAEAYKIEPAKPSTMKNMFQWLKDRAKMSSESITKSLDDKMGLLVSAIVANEVFSMDIIREEIAGTLEQEADWRVNRIANTELITIYSEMAQRTYKDNGMKYVLWLTANDERTCEVCGGNDNEIVELGQAFPSGDYVEPAHINCRCMTMPTNNKFSFA